ncbi:hypothetical protein I7I48_07375 [Histoplasma ohiense]|nr:hypothetical protein I7I48_07375 [Histoplasma ohiense (nom. inval.)]
MIRSIPLVLMQWFMHDFAFSPTTVFEFSLPNRLLIRAESCVACDYVGFTLTCLHAFHVDYCS